MAQVRRSADSDVGLLSMFTGGGNDGVVYQVGRYGIRIRAVVLIELYRSSRISIVLGFPVLTELYGSATLRTN